MDDFGMYATLRTSLVAFENHSRRTGRTNRIIDQCQPIDIIIVHSSDMMRHINSILRDKHKTEIQVRTCQASFPGIQEFIESNRHKITGNIHFDNAWIFKFYENELSYIQTGIEGLMGSVKRIPEEMKNIPRYKF